MPFKNRNQDTTNYSNHLIDEVMVSPIKVANGYQVELYIKGALPDGCELRRYTEIKSETEHGFFVHMYRKMPPEMACPAMLVFFEESLRIPRVYPAGTIIAIQVNDYRMSYILPD